MSSSTRAAVGGDTTPGCPGRTDQNGADSTLAMDSTLVDNTAQLPVEDADEGEDEPPKFKPGWRFYLSFVAIASLTLAAAIDATALSVALPALADDLNGTAIESFWIGTSFLISSAIVMPIFAALSHVFGRKRCMQVGCVVFTAGTIMGAVAGDMLTCLIGRAIQGIGAGAVVVLGEIIITDLVPLNERGKWLGWLGTMWAFGGVIGPLAAGAFAQYVTWRWVFWINLPFIAIGFVLLQLYFHQKPIHGDTLAKVARIDWTGAILFTVSACAILIPISVGGIIISWEKWPILLSLFVGVDGIIAFVWWEKFRAKEPLIPLTIFHNWTLRALYIQTVLHALVFWATMYYLPLYYQVVKQYTIFNSGLAMLPQTIVVSPLTVIIGILINRLNAYRWSVYGGWIFTVLGAGLLIILDLETTIAVWVIVNVAFCIGIGTLITAMNFAVQAAVQAKYCGDAVAFYVFLRQFGEGLGVAVGGIIFQNQLRKNLDDLDISGDDVIKYTQKATTLAPVIKELAEGLFKSQLLDAYVGALRTLWISALAISAVGLLLCTLIKKYNMNKRIETEQAFVMTPTTKEEDLSSAESGTLPIGPDGQPTDHVYDCTPDLDFPAPSLQRRVSEAITERSRRQSLADSRRFSTFSASDVTRRPSMAASMGRQSLAERRGQGIVASTSQGSMATVIIRRPAENVPPMPSPKALAEHKEELEKQKQTFGRA